MCIRQGTHDDLRERPPKDNLDVGVQVLFVHALRTLEEARRGTDRDLRRLRNEVVHVLCRKIRRGLLRMYGIFTDENDVVVQLALILIFAIHLRHRLQGVEHALHDALVRRVHIDAYFRRLGTDELALDAADVHGEVLDEGRDALPLLGRHLRLADVLDLLVLWEGLSDACEPAL